MKAKCLLLTMFWVGILSACTNAETFKDVLYFTGTEDSPTVKYTVDGPSEIGVTISASCLTMSDQVIRVKVDSDKLEGYNTLYGKKYKMVPTLLLCRMDGNKEMMLGTMGKPELRKVIEGIL